MPPDRRAVVDYLRERAGRPLKARDLARALGVSARDYPEFRKLLAELEAEGAIYRVKGRRFAVPEKINLVVGRLQTIRSGDGFVVPTREAGGRDIFVPGHRFGSAVDGDLVVARVEGRRRGGQPEGTVIKVLERAHPTVVGTYHRTRNFGYVAPQDRRIPRDVLVPRGLEREAREGDIVVVKVTSWGDGHLNPTGEVDVVLGALSEPGVDVLAVLYGHGLPLDFPPEVAEEAERVARRAGPPRPGPGRRDRRELHVFTIDPADARDHDDALSVAPKGEGLWEVGIHIADVSHYVEEGGALDLEAYRRGTSVYLVDRVVPMLPEPLSADLCSLLPDRDRLALSLFVTLDAEGRIRDHRLERTVIRSRRRLDYREVQRVLDGEARLDPETDRGLEGLRRLARALRGRREARGSLDFDLPEARVELGKEGEPVDIQRVIRLESHRLVEEFMILANEIVARRAVRKKLPFIYRIHEPPDPKKVEQLRDFLASLGHPLPRRREIRPRDLQAVLRRVEGRPEEALVSTVILRSLMQARYSTVNRGHFGLASSAYAHFTSPIRRYPDLVVHRVLVRAFLDRRPLPEAWAETLPAAAATASERERVAQDAERDSVELKKVEFMERHLGDVFRGTVSGVTSFGLFVLLDDYFVEGLVHVSSLEDDYYRLAEGEYALVGERTGRRFRLADRVTVQVARVDVEEREIDFVLRE